METAEKITTRTPPTKTTGFHFLRQAGNVVRGTPLSRVGVEVSAFFAKRSHLDQGAFHPTLTNI